MPDSSGGTTTFTPDGTGTVQDNATEEDGKEFFTITTADGNVYYLVIDRQRGQENVYFLNTVTEADLLALAEAGVVPGETAIPDTIDPEPEPDTSEPEPDAEPEKDNGGMGSIIFIILGALAVGGAAWYFKIYKPKQQAGFEDDFDGLEDLDDPDDDYGLDVDDAPPFDIGDEADARDAYEQDDGIGYGPGGDE